MRLFLVSIGHRGQPPRLEFAALAVDAVTATMEYLELADEGESVRVEPVRKVEQKVFEVAHG